MYKFCNNFQYAYNNLDEFHLLKKIVVITSKNSVGYNDFISAFNMKFYENKDEFSIDVRYEKFENLKELCLLIQYLDTEGYDAICIVRGGGDSCKFQVFQTDHFIKCITETITPIFLGIGHYNTYLYSAKFADYSATSPSALGCIIDNHNHMINLIKLIKNTITDKNNTIRNLEMQLQERQKENNTIKNLETQLQEKQRKIKDLNWLLIFIGISFISIIFVLLSNKFT